MNDTEHFAVDQADDLAALFIGIAVGVEFALDFGAAGPFPEFLFFGLSGGGEVEGQALLFEGEAASAEFAAAEGQEEHGEMAEMAQGFIGAGIGGRKSPGCGSEAEENPTGEFFRHVGRENLLEFGIAVIEGGGKSDGFLTVEPVTEAVVPVVGEVLLVDGSAVELGFEEGLGFGQGIEPREEGIGGFGILEALIDLLLDGSRQGGDFSEHRSGKVRG